MGEIISPYIFNMKEATSITALKQVNNILINNDWADGYQFRSSEYFFLRDLKTKTDKLAKQIVVYFTLEYKTKAHKVINFVEWRYDYDKVLKLNSDIEWLELEIMLKTSDPDVTDQVFGKTFRKQLFDEKHYECKGWIIKK